MEMTIKNISVRPSTWYGNFIISGNVNGEAIEVTTTDSTIYDNRCGTNCDTEEEMLAHEEAMKYCKIMLVKHYEFKHN
jgi:hypothetical protein